MGTREHVPTDLVRALEAIARVQQRWLTDVEAVCAGDPRFLDAFRRWEEILTLLKLHLHRAEQRLLHFLMLPEERRPWRELRGFESDGSSEFRIWMERIGPYMRSLHIDTAYRRLGTVLDPGEEPITADVVTDMVALCELAATCGRAIDQLGDPREQAPHYLEDLAFFHVLAPWKTQGVPALHDVLRWLSEFLAANDEL